MKSRDDQELTNTVRANLGSLIIKLSLCTDASLSTITTVLGTNPVQVARRWIAKDIRSLSSQSECAFNAIHWLWLIDNWPTPKISGLIGQWVTAPHRHREGMGSNPVEVLNFSGFSMQLLKIAFITVKIIASLDYWIVLLTLWAIDHFRYIKIQLGSEA